MQRRCIPPRPGGKACDGPEVLSRPCNTDPCPTEAESTESKYERGTIRTIPYSANYQRYERCIIIEIDLDVVRNDLK